MSVLELPDEIWRKILEMGVKNSKLGFKDLCCVSISMESQIFVHSTKLKQLRSQFTEETQRLNSASNELNHLHHVYNFTSIFFFTASVALNVWQPDIVRGSQKQVVEQCTVPIESRIRSLEMEHKLCKQQIAVFKKAYGDEKKRLDTAKKQLDLYNNNISGILPSAKERSSSPQTIFFFYLDQQYYNAFISTGPSWFFQCFSSITW
ncbi:hypothetical protein MKW94_006840 [Papaver nudicaule]|uniref:Uncharacterized protein n=1 Tax=Papaver nudicaule TaxID=74823 RepID=A0AA41VJ77_PAPNU|nr:hypothetical protein [Papaver nudicaule]